MIYLLMISMFFFPVVACRKPNMQMIAVNDRPNYGVLLRHC